MAENFLLGVFSVGTYNSKIITYNSMIEKLFFYPLLLSIHFLEKLLLILFVTFPSVFFVEYFYLAN